MNVNPRDIWDTPPEAVQSLLRHLPRNIGFYEPCAGAGALSNASEAHGHRSFSYTHLDVYKRQAHKRKT